MKVKIRIVSNGPIEFRASCIADSARLHGVTVYIYECDNDKNSCLLVFDGDAKMIDDQINYLVKDAVINGDLISYRNIPEDEMGYSDMTPRYAPKTIMTTQFGIRPVHSTMFFPIGVERPPNCPIVENTGALLLRTDSGDRWFGCANAYINSEMRMVVVGCMAGDEVRMKWEVVKIIT